MTIWKKLNRNKFRTRLILFFLLSLFISLGTTLYTFINSNTLVSSTENLFKKDIELNQLHESIADLENSLELFLSTSTSESMTEFNRKAANLAAWANDILDETDNSEQGLMMKDIGNLMKTYIENGNAAIIAKRERKIEQYVKSYNDSTVTASYLYRGIDTLMVQQLQDSAKYYTLISNRVAALQVINIILIVVSSIVIVVMIFVFSFKLTNPIDKLVHLSKRISRGDFDVSTDFIDSDDEIAVLSKAFHEMVPRLKSYVEGITEKAELEVKLKEEHMQNLTMKTALREAQLHALQTQINPHFIFNTINAGAQIAMLEGDNKTSEFLVEAAGLIRYNLKSMDTPVTFKDELDNVRSYIYILKTRFHDLVNYVEEIEDDKRLLSLKMPRLTLQPVVENAYIHGLSELENGGTICIRATVENRRAVISVMDSGKGLDPTQREILQETINGPDVAPKSEPPKGGHTTGIGLNNIAKRLRLFYGYEKVLSIGNNAGGGVCVTFNLPIKQSKLITKRS
jgi:two-component system sensor histidine kinase YesM